MVMEELLYIRKSHHPFNLCPQPQKLTANTSSRSRHNFSNKTTVTRVDLKVCTNSKLFGDGNTLIPETINPLFDLGGGALYGCSSAYFVQRKTYAKMSYSA